MSRAELPDSFLHIAAPWILRAEYDQKHLLYVGLAVAGSAESDAAWLIRKCTYDVDGNCLTILLANASVKMNAKWTERGTYAYG